MTDHHDKYNKNGKVRHEVSKYCWKSGADGLFDAGLPQIFSL